MFPGILQGASAGHKIPVHPGCAMWRFYKGSIGGKFSYATLSSFFLGEFKSTPHTYAIIHLLKYHKPLWLQA
jgi:hypothetical protein